MLDVEVDDQANPELGDAQIIEHLTPLMVRDAINDFRIHNHGFDGNQIGNEFTDKFIFVTDLKSALLVKSHTPAFEFQSQ